LTPADFAEQGFQRRRKLQMQPARALQFRLEHLDRDAGRRRR
jgi:hypothetical protein